MKLLFTFPLLIILVLGTCKKPQFETHDNYNKVPPIILSTSLKDSLPAEAIKVLKLGEVTGIKIQYITGVHASYFEYQADPNAVLTMLSQLPFFMNTLKADTVCHQIPLHDLNLIKQKLSVTEIESTQSFWNTSQAEVEIYECIKPPFKHTVITSENSNHILHRVEFLG
jgi:hypothetical protein